MSEELSFDAEAFLSDAGRATPKSTFEEDKIIFSQGEAADSIFYISKGKVKLTVLSEQGKEAVVAILGPGDFFGEGCLAGQPLRMATAANDDGMLDYPGGKSRHDPRTPRRAGIFREIHVAPSDAQYPS